MLLQTHTVFVYARFMGIDWCFWIYFLNDSLTQQAQRRLTVAPG